jgi:thiamine pyrophosphate-dependent acetolactate synthase large subunit-like protein
LAKVAAGWGAKTFVADGIETLRQSLRVAFATEGPSVVVALVDSSIDSPMGDRFRQFEPEARP